MLVCLHKKTDRTLFSFFKLSSIKSTCFSAIKNATICEKQPRRSAFKALQKIENSPTVQQEDPFFSIELDSMRRNRQQKKRVIYTPIDRTVFGSFHSAMMHRLGVASASKEEFFAALTHPKIFAKTIEKFYCYKKIGESALKFLIVEHVQYTYPKASIQDYESLVAKYYSRQSLHSVGSAYGIFAYYEYVDCEEFFESILAVMGFLHNNLGLLQFKRFLHSNLLCVNHLSHLAAFFECKNPSVRMNLLMKRLRQPLIEHRYALDILF